MEDGRARDRGSDHVGETRLPTLVQAIGSSFTGWADLKFPFDRVLKDVIKAMPGVYWDPDRRVWCAPGDAIAALATFSKVRFDYSKWTVGQPVPIPQDAAERLKLFQQEGVAFMTSRRGSLLAFAMRLGKTPTSITAARALAEAGLIDAVLVAYPASVRAEWMRQVPAWWPGQALFPIKAKGQRDAGYDDGLEEHLAGFPILGVHYELLGLPGYAEEIRGLLQGKRFVVIGDEFHLIKNRKAPRTNAMFDFSVAAAYRWALTGTPMRNRNKDVYALFQFVNPLSVGKTPENKPGYWKFAKRYAGAIENAHGGMDDKGESNTDELRLRLAMIGLRKTREEVAAELPQALRDVILCEATGDDLKKYRKLAAALAPRINLDAEPGEEDREALAQLCAITARAKTPFAIERALHYTNEGHKVVVFAHFHETLKLVEEVWEKVVATNAKQKHPEPLPVAFRAAGYDSPDDRDVQRAAWQAHQGPAILFANTMSTGIGIDLSDAEGAIFVELEWVPSDLRQAEDRIVDVHQGKRNTPPSYEYLVVKGTIDENMAAALLKKIRNIDAAGLGERDLDAVARALRESDAAGNLAVLENTDSTTVTAALRGLRDAMLAPVTTDDSDDLVSDAFAMDEDEDDDTDDEDTDE
jgi:SNF2 family DNA or RNA helicase